MKHSKRKKAQKGKSKGVQSPLPSSSYLSSQTNKQQLNLRTSPGTVLTRLGKELWIGNKIALHNPKKVPLLQPQHQVSIGMQVGLIYGLLGSWTTWWLTAYSLCMATVWVNGTGLMVLFFLNDGFYPSNPSTVLISKAFYVQCSCSTKKYSSEFHSIQNG